MSVQNATLSVGASVTPSGGTDRTYVVTGKKVNNGVHIVQSTATSGITAKHGYAVSREAAVLANGEFGLAQRSIRFVNPLLSTRGNYCYPSAEFVLRPHPESTQADINELKSLVIQALIEGDFNSLFSVGSLS